MGKVHIDIPTALIIQELGNSNILYYNGEVYEVIDESRLNNDGNKIRTLFYRHSDGKVFECRFDAEEPITHMVEYYTPPSKLEQELAIGPIRKAMIEHLKMNKSKYGNQKVLAVGPQSFTCDELISEMSMNTAVAQKIEVNILELTIDLLMRGVVGNEQVNGKAKTS